MTHSEKVQFVVDKMAKHDGEKWVLDHSYAEEFFNLIDHYIKKSAYKSEYEARGDPEDASAEVRFEVWKALERYGPRPYGHLFADYTLKLKTNNCLTNRANKKKSFKSRLNYISDSLDTIQDLENDGGIKNIPHTDALNPEIFDKKESVGKSPVNVKKLEKLTKRLSIERRKELFKILTSSILKDLDDLLYIYKKGDNVEKEKKRLEDLEAQMARDIEQKKIQVQEAKEKYDFKIGDVFVTQCGKIVEFKGKTENGHCKLFLRCTSSNTTVSPDYLKNHAILYSEKDKIDDFETVESGKKLSSLVLLNEPKKEDKKEQIAVKKKGTKVARKGTIRALIIDLLQQGPQTSETLAKAILASDLGKESTLEKAKNYASVVLSTLKREGFQIKKVKDTKSTYVLDA